MRVAYGYAHTIESYGCKDSGLRLTESETELTDIVEFVTKPQHWWSGLRLYHKRMEQSRTLFQLMNPLFLGLSGYQGIVQKNVLTSACPQRVQAINNTAILSVPFKTFATFRSLHRNSRHERMGFMVSSLKNEAIKQARARNYQVSARIEQEPFKAPRRKSV